jgi:hypothetical protein
VRNGLTVFITSSANEEEGSLLHRLSVNVVNYTPCDERTFPKLLSIFSVYRRSIKTLTYSTCSSSHSPRIAVTYTSGSNEATEFERLAFHRDVMCNSEVEYFNPLTLNDL